VECIYFLSTKEIQRRVKCSPQFRRTYDDNVKLDMIMEKLGSILHKKLILIKPNLQISSENFRSEKLSTMNREKYPLNFLFHSQNVRKRLFREFNWYINNLFSEVQIKIVKVNDQIIPKVIQTFHHEDIEFEIDEMGDGFRKTLSMIIRIFVSDSHIIIIDEPDSSMHAKLIKDLINYLKGLGKQVIISTHNEIFINEFEMKSLKYMYAKSPVFATIEDSEKFDLNRIFFELGVNVNYNKSSLLSSQIILLVEGTDDEKYIKLLLQKTGHDKELSYRIDYVVTQGNKIPDINIIDRMNKTQVPVLLVRDRDENQKEYFEKYENRLGSRVHFWKRREVENYFMSYKSILKAINEKNKIRSLLYHN